MSRHILCASLVACAFTLTAVAVSARAQSTADFPPVSDNAALQYWTAFGTMPELDADQEKLLENWETVPLDDAVDKLLDQCQPSLKFLRRAAAMRTCDWGLDYKDGVYMYLPHLGKAKKLARIAALDARRGFEKGDLAVVGDDARSMFIMSRHVGGDTLVSLLVGYAIQGMTVNVVAPYLPKVKASYADVMAAYNLLPPAPRLEQAIRAEKRMATTIIIQLREAERLRPGSWREALASMIGPESPNPFKDSASLDEVVHQLDNFLATYDELATLIALPPAEFDAKYPPFVQRAKAANPVAELLLPAMDKVIASQRRSDVRLAMLLASIAVVESGPEKLADIKDPYGDGPFAYSKRDEGFELTSKLEIDGKRVSLIVGEKEKK